MTPAGGAVAYPGPMALHRGIDGSDPVRGEPVGRLDGTYEQRRDARSGVLAAGTLACPACDAPVMPAGPMSPAQSLDCPYCARHGRVRDFLSLSEPARPARVEVRVVQRVRLPARTARTAGGVGADPAG